MSAKDVLRVHTGRASRVERAPSLPCCVVAWLLVGTAAAAQVQTVQYNRDVRPILSERCFRCHGPDSAARKANLRLDREADVLADRTGRRVIVPGRPQDSELWKRISSGDPDTRMPPQDQGRPLAAREVEVLRRWIEQGAEWQQHWSYGPLKRPWVPPVATAGWALNAIDQFILARLAAERLQPSPQADERTLVRRVYFDLLGLPPSQAELTTFLDDPAPDRFDRLVDRLLQSPHYGERMAVHWLDLVRYADTVGYHGDQEHAISPYRDYVIQAFNDNMPFDQFTTEQLAGDLLPDPTLAQRIATGYNRLLQTSHEGGVQQKEYLAKYAADRVRNLGSVWLGATLGCCECHDHKYDPFTQRDFYSLEAFFADVDDYRTFKGGDVTPTKREPEIEVPGRRTMITEAIKPRPTRVLARGDWMDESGAIVDPAVPQVFRQIAQTGRATRLDLAEWLVARDSGAPGLTARVFVNRLWKLFFGKGLSSRLDDLGAQGETPVHAELLDWLAVEFMDSGWDAKHMVRLIVTSRTYRQSSVESAAMRQRDPENRLLARQTRPRLDAEFIRDNALAVSGLLVRDVGGRSARPYQPPGYYQHLNFPKREYQPDTGEQQYRRGVYTHWQRAYLHPMLKAFDAPSREECTAERAISNTPQAALVLLNDPTFVEAARVLAIRVMREGGSDTERRICWAWSVAVGRDASGREATVLRQLFEQDVADYRADGPAAERLVKTGLSPVPSDIDAAELAAWTTVARALFNLGEVITRN